MFRCVLVSVTLVASFALFGLLELELLETVFALIVEHASDRRLVGTCGEAIRIIT